ncbi:MAG: GerAB/ArcD/ProY family transporter [Clostridia bacterium]|nr:GerAB/ArcD/ProY family transporter [Clostridia bacterium]
MIENINHNKQLKTRQICLFFIAFTPLTKLFSMPSVLALLSSHDLWISALINVVIDLITLFFLISVAKRTDKTYFEMLKDFFGNVGAKIICTLYVVFFLLKSIVPITEQKNYLEATLYLSMPSFLYFFGFFIVAFYLATKKMRVLGRLSDVLFSFTLSGFLTLIFLSLNNVDFTSVLPIGAMGFKNIFAGSYHTFSWFGDAVYMVFFLGNFIKTKRFGIKIVASYLVNAVMVLLFLIVFYGIFTSIAFRQRFALTEIAKYTTVISNTGRIDYLAIISLLFPCIISTALPLFLACKILEQVFNIKNKFISPLIIIGLTFLFVWIFEEYYYSIKGFILNILSFILLVFSNIFPLIFIFTKNKEKYEKN